MNANTLNLILDVGNSRLSWRILKGGKTYNEGVLNHLEPDWRNRFVQTFAGFAGPCRIIGGSVAAKSVEDRLQTWFMQNCASAVTWLRATEEALGVHCGYRRPATLGIDRWAAVVAAYRDAQCAVMVVDLGSAATVDYVDENGQHAGGVIAPGLRLMRQALTAGTRLDASEATGAVSVELGRATTDAIQSGVVWSLVGLIEQSLGRVEARYGRVGRLLLTGGDAEFVRPYLMRQWECRPGLVLDGLALLDQERQGACE